MQLEPEGIYIANAVIFIKREWETCMFGLMYWPVAHCCALIHFFPIIHGRRKSCISLGVVDGWWDPQKSVRRVTNSLLTACLSLTDPNRRASCWTARITTHRRARAWLISNFISSNPNPGSPVHLQYSSLRPTLECATQLRTASSRNYSHSITNPFALPPWTILFLSICLAASFMLTFRFPVLALTQCHLFSQQPLPIVTKKCHPPSTLYCSLWVEDKRFKSNQVEVNL